MKRKFNKFFAKPKKNLIPFNMIKINRANRRQFMKLNFSITQILSTIINFFTYLKKINSKSSYTPGYRVVEVLKNENEDYTVLIQVINSRSTFYAKPEELLVDDSLVRLFSPLDVRTLTYLGYIGINSPKYKILAQRLANEGSLVFVVAQKGAKETILKTASEIMRDNKFIQNMNAADASAVGYASAAETVTEEFKQKTGGFIPHRNFPL